MKKTLSLIICMCMVIGIIPAFTVGAVEVADPTNAIPDWAEVIGLTAEPGTKIADYKFTGSNIPGEAIPNNFKSSGDYKGEYTEDGFTLTKLTEPLQSDRTASSGVGGVLHLVANLEQDMANGTTTYQHGLIGTYVVDLYINSNLSTNLTGASVRFDWDVGYQPDFTNTSKVEKAFHTIRVTSADALMFYDGSTAYNQGDYKYQRGKDTIARLVIDTTNKRMAYFIYKNNKFVFSGNGAYNGDIIQSISFTPRLGFAKGSTFTFKGVKIYEIDRPVNPELGIADRNYAISEALEDETIMPKTLVSNPDAVVENISLPEGVWTTSDDSVITTEGIVKRGYGDEKIVLSNKYKTASTPSLQLFRLYNLNVLKRADVVNETIYENNFNKNVDDLTMKVNRVVASDEYSSTYINSLSGVYDFEFEVTPSVAKTFAENGMPVSINVGYDDGEEYVNYATIDIYKDVARYNTNALPYTSVSIKNEDVNKFKVRVDTINKQIWVYVNGVKSDTMQYIGNDFVNTFKMNVEEDSDSLYVGTTKVISVFADDNVNFSNADINSCIADSENITMDDVTSKQSDAYGKMGDLPSTLNGYDVKWSADSDFVDLESKYAFRGSEKQNVTVTAEIYDGKNSAVRVYKIFSIVIEGTNDPELLLESSTSKLAARFITNQPANGLITDIVLPDTIDNNTVTWAVSPSSPSDVLSADGVINKNKDISEPTKVILTAAVTNGTATAYKDVEFTVAKRGADVTLFTDTASIETPMTGVVTYEAILNGTAVLKDSDGKKIIDLDANGNVKVIMDFNNSKVTVFEDGVLLYDYIDFSEAAKNFKTVESTNVSNEKVILDEYSLYNYNIEKFGYLDEIEKGVIISDIDMSSSALGGAVVTWNSHNTAILSNDGTYNAPANITFFDVDFSITRPGGTGATYNKTFNVVAIPEDNIFAGSDVLNDGESVPAGEYQTDAMVDGNFTDTMFRGAFINQTSSIVIDMKNTQDINTMFIANNGLVSCDIYVSNDKVDWTLVAQPEFDGTEAKNIVTFKKENARYVKIDNIVYTGDYVDIYEIAGFVVYDSSDKSYIDITELDMPKEYVLTATSITLPATGSLYGSIFTWKSSHPDVISINGTVTKPKKNTEVILTVTSKNGDATSTKRFRYYVKGNGDAQTGSSYGGSGGGNIFIGENSSSAFPEVNTTVQPSVSSSDKLFEDVKTTDWFYTYVLDLKNENIIDGDDNNRFNPNNYVTREEFVKMIVNAAGLELVVNGKGFGDVESTAWYAPYVYAAKANGIVNGISENEFGVGAPISRQDMSVIINNIIDRNADISSNWDLFTDDANISSYAYEAVYTMKSLGILNGYESGEFNPKGQLTRAEAAKVISMVMDIIK